ncbi:MAG: putative LPS assembly protein LptD [Calditrichota bacterium]
MMIPIILFYLILGSSPSFSQDQLPPDSLTRSIADSLTPPPSSELDTTVVYSAGHVDLTFNPRITILTDSARVQYHATILEADRIEVLWDDQLLIARGRLDTLKLDSAGVFRDSVYWKGQPKLDDGSQVIVGREMTYHLKTRQGRVLLGTTAYQDGFYHGDQIKKVEKDVYNIRSGFYTTCDAPEPHYGFWSRDMKLIVKDKVVARPVVLYFGPAPVLIIPFGVFPTKGGRRSGIIMPTYGESAGQGRYFTNLGYYWAPNDYGDVRGTFNYYERYGIRFFGDTRYALRYYLNGGVSGSYIAEHRGGGVIRRWDLRLNHSQTISPTMNFVANGYFVSDGSYQKDVSQDQAKRLEQKIQSDATLNKRWTGTPYSASLNVNYTEDLKTGSGTRSLPRVSFSRNSQPLIPPAVGIKPNESPWFNRIYFSYGGGGEIFTNIAVNRYNYRWEEVDDSLVQRWDETKTSRVRSGVKHGLTLTSAFNVLYFNLSPSLNYSEQWFDEWLEYRRGEDDAVDTVKHNALIARRTFSGSMSLNTKLYGLFKPRFLGWEALRHTLSPGVSFRYQPDFSEARWKYYDVLPDEAGNPRYYDRFAGNIYGSTLRGKQMTMGLSVDNLFEYKKLHGEQEVKGELFTLGLSTSHNFAADSLKWSDLSSSLVIKPIGGGALKGWINEFSGISLDLRGTHSFYAQETNPSTGQVYTVNHSAPRGLRLLDFTVGSSFRVAGGAFTLRPDSASIRDDTTQTDIISTGWRPSSSLWSAGFNFHYNENHTNPGQIRKNIWISSQVELQATKNWSINYNTRYDLIRKELVFTTITLKRDLHCWEGQLVWTPVGGSKGYYLIINVKSPQLKDVKVEKREGGGGVFGY